MRSFHRHKLVDTDNKQYDYPLTEASLGPCSRQALCPRASLLSSDSWSSGPPHPAFQSYFARTHTSLCPCLQGPYLTFINSQNACVCTAFNSSRKVF